MATPVVLCYLALRISMRAALCGTCQGLQRRRLVLCSLSESETAKSLKHQRAMLQAPEATARPEAGRTTAPAVAPRLEPASESTRCEKGAAKGRRLAAGRSVAA